MFYSILFYSFCFFHAFHAKLLDILEVEVLDIFRLSCLRLRHLSLKHLIKCLRESLMHLKGSPRPLRGRSIKYLSERYGWLCKFKYIISLPLYILYSFLSLSFVGCVNVAYLYIILNNRVVSWGNKWHSIPNLEFGF